MKAGQGAVLGRRRFLVTLGAAATLGTPGILRAAEADAKASAERAEALAQLAAYIAGGATATFPDEVLERARRHILDALAAMVSGSRLQPGQLAIKYIRSQRGSPDAQVAGTQLLTSVTHAAFANGMSAHADETDDSHRATLAHPGAAVVPAALAMAEHAAASGRTFLHAVIVGYDVGCRMVLALGPDRMLGGAGATPSIGGCFGAAAACGVIAGLDHRAIPQLLAYAVQQASGVNSWVRDTEHVEKAFVFGGMPARNGAMAAQLVQAGFSGEPEPFTGPGNFLDAFSRSVDLSWLTAGAARPHEIMLTDMKRFPVGFPIQAAMDAVLKIIARGVQPADIRSLTVRLPAPGVVTVNDRSMPDVNVQYIMAATLLDRQLTFDAAHSLGRMKDPAVLELKQRIMLVEDTELTQQKRTREANIEVIRTDGSSFTEHGAARGILENPMTLEEVEDKARQLLAPILGNRRCEQLIRTMRDLETLKSMRALRPLLAA